MAGFSKGLVVDLDLFLPPGSLLVVEDPGVAQRRGVAERVASVACVGGLVLAPIHDEDAAETLPTIVARPPQARAVIPAVEYGVVAAAALAAAWELPGAGLTAARTIREKFALRSHAEVAGIPQPCWQLVDGPDALRDARAGWGGNCVLKPTGRQGSLGVQLLGPGDDLDAAWALTVDAHEHKLRTTPVGSETYLAEELVEGPEVSVECLVLDGEVIFLNVTDKLVLGGRHPVESGHSVPAETAGGVGAELFRLMRLLVTSTGFGSGVLHAEWILVDGVRPYLVECAGRLPGDHIDELIDLAYGGRLAEDLVAVLEGRRPARGRNAEQSAAIRFLIAAPGTVRSVGGLDAARDVTGVVSVDLSARVGDAIAPAHSSSHRVGSVVATGRTRREAGSRAESALQRITVVTA